MKYKKLMNLSLLVVRLYLLIFEKKSLKRNKNLINTLLILHFLFDFISSTRTAITK